MLFADLAREFFIELAFKFGKDFGAEGLITSAANEILKSFSRLVPGRGVVMDSACIFGTIHYASRVVFGIKILGRKDGQVKIRGFRVELQSLPVM